MLNISRANDELGAYVIPLMGSANPKFEARHSKYQMTKSSMFQT